MRNYIRDKFISLMQDNKGNLAIITVLLLPLMISVAGIAIDVADMSNTRDKMRDASDAGALAAAKALSSNGVSTSDARKIVLDFLKAHSPEGSDFSSDVHVAITSTGSGDSKVHRVTVDTHYKHPVSSMTRFLGIVNTEVSTKSRAISGEKVVVQQPISFVLITDRSESMSRPATDGNIKLDALKYAVKEMEKSFDRIDPDKRYIRTGGIAFSSRWVDPKGMAWGSSHVVEYVQGFTAWGNTIPLDALEYAKTTLMSASETNAQIAKNGRAPKRVILYMTDGQNWPRVDREPTRAELDELDRKALVKCKNAKDSGIEVYAIGFSINRRGEDFLMACATSRDHVYLPTGSASLIESFKKITEAVSTEVKPRIAM